MTTTALPTMAGVDVLAAEFLLSGLPRIPRGDVTLVYGTGAIGKGRLVWSWIAEVINTDPDAVVLVILPEDHPNEAVAPRLRDAGVSDPSRVINMTRLPDGSRFKLSADLTHAGHLGLLRQYVEDTAGTGLQVRMIVIDPLASVVGFGSVQSNAGARRLLEPLQDLSADTGIATVVVAHSVKSGVLQGSAGLSQAARLVYQVYQDRSNPGVRVLTVEKANNLPPTADLRFVIEADDAGHVLVVPVDKAEADRRQRQWREPVHPVHIPTFQEAYPEPAAAAPVPRWVAESREPPRKRPQRSGLRSVPDPAARRNLVAQLLGARCPECGRPNATGCDSRYPGSKLVPISFDPLVVIHMERAGASWEAGFITEDELDRVLAAAS